MVTGCRNARRHTGQPARPGDYRHHTAHTVDKVRELRELITVTGSEALIEVDLYLYLFFVFQLRDVRFAYAG